MKVIDEAQGVQLLHNGSSFVVRGVDHHSRTLWENDLGTSDESLAYRIFAAATR